MEFHRARRRLCKAEDVETEERRLLEEISIRVHSRDTMYQPGQAEHYLSVGLSAVRCIDAALGSRPARSAVRSVLDFPCGYGRVLRFLRVLFPAARLTGAEIDGAALDFCRTEFGVNSFRSDADLGRLSLPERFDLIWCGSLLTHVDEAGTASLLRFFCDHLSDRGFCLFTTHGSLSADWLQNGTYAYGLEETARESLLSDYRASGYGYADYGGGSGGYGISVASPSRIAELARAAGAWRKILFLEHGWDRHQDLHAYTRTPPEVSPAVSSERGPTYLKSAGLYTWRH